MTIGDRIRDARRSRGMTQRDLARALGVNQSAVGQWESKAQGKAPSRANLGALADVLQLSVSALLLGETAAGDTIALGDPREIELTKLFRMMTQDQKSIHLSLFYSTIGIPEPGEKHRRPSDRVGTRAARAAK